MIILKLIAPLVLTVAVSSSAWGACGPRIDEIPKSLFQLSEGTVDSGTARVVNVLASRVLSAEISNTGPLAKGYVLTVAKPNAPLASFYCTHSGGLSPDERILISP
jgi:hypothetical protein